MKIKPTLLTIAVVKKAHKKKNKKPKIKNKTDTSGHDLKII